MVTAGERWHGGSDILVDLCLVVNLGDHPRLGHCSTPGVPGGRVGKGGGGGGGEEKGGEECCSYIH